MYSRYPRPIVRGKLHSSHTGDVPMRTLPIDIGGSAIQAPVAGGPPPAAPRRDEGRGRGDGRCPSRRGLPHDVAIAGDVGGLVGGVPRCGQDGRARIQRGATRTRSRRSTALWPNAASGACTFARHAARLQSCSASGSLYARMLSDTWPSRSRAVRQAVPTRRPASCARAPSGTLCRGRSPVRRARPDERPYSLGLHKLHHPTLFSSVNPQTPIGSRFR